MKVGLIKISILAIFLLLLSNVAIGSSTKNIVLPTIFTNNLVLQQNDSVAIWGKAMSNQKVTIETSWRESEAVIAGKGGNWKIKLKTPQASLAEQEIVIRTNTDKITLTNVLIGEVWLCSGQSNMLFRLKFDDNGESEIIEANRPHLRLFKVPPVTSSKPLSDIENASWQVCSPNTVKDFSAVAYYFGKKILLNLSKTPVGLISAAYGSSSIEAFMSKKALSSKQYLADHLNNYSTKIPSKVPTACFNAMINPLIPYSIKGIVWYQGESNCVRASHYYEALHTMIKYRRMEFENPMLPFYIVQLPPFKYNASQQEPGDNFSAATVRDAQFQIVKSISHAGLVVTTDLGDVNNLHPANKKAVGDRLGNLALNQSYGQKDKVYSGPVFNSYIKEGNAIRLTFDFVENGIKDPNAELNWFTIAGSDKKFYQANAFIDGKDIVVSSPYVGEPIAVRFGWYNSAVPNFFNAEGLPASPFKTDNWTTITYAGDIESWSSVP